MRTWLNRARLWYLTATAGGGLFVLQGCDPGVRDTVLGGVEGAATTLLTTFIQAFFESLTSQDEEAPATVQAIVHHLTSALA